MRGLGEEERFKWFEPIDFGIVGWLDGWMVGWLDGGWLDGFDGWAES